MTAVSTSKATTTLPLKVTAASASKALHKAKASLTSVKSTKMNKTYPLLQLIKTGEDEADEMYNANSTPILKDVSCIEDVRERSKFKITTGYFIKLQVAHMTVPKKNATGKDIVHVYLVNCEMENEFKIVKAFSDRLALLLEEPSLGLTLRKNMIRATVWESTMEECSAQFTIGSVIRIKKFTNLNAYKELIQLNCNLKNVAVVTN